MFRRENVRYYLNTNASDSGMWQSISLIKYAMDNSAKHSLTKLMVSHDLMHSTVLNQVALDQRDLHLTYQFECAMDRLYQALVYKLETLHTITFTNCLTQFWELFTVIYCAPKNFRC